MAEIEDICAKYGQAYLIFRDPLFSAERERSMGIAEGIIRKKLNVKFECETRLDDLDHGLIDLLHRVHATLSERVPANAAEPPAATPPRAARAPAARRHERVEPLVAGAGR